MKVPQVPTVNKNFIANGIKENKRIDTRARDEFRDIRIGFGIDFGVCATSLGNTKVLSSVSCEIGEPKSTKPSEGVLNINVDLSPMANPDFEGRHNSAKSVEITRMIEKTIRDSQCVDLESLCLIKGEKVWMLRVDVITLNDDGNLVECCSVAALASLAHFRRPDVTVKDEKVHVHTLEEKHPLPITILHYPFCTSFIFVQSCLHHVADPVGIEEQVCDGYLVVGANSYREITALHISGKSRIEKDKVMRCCNVSIERVKLLTSQLKAALAADRNVKSSKQIDLGFVTLLQEEDSSLSKYKSSKKKVEIEENEEEEVETFEFAPVYKSKLYRFKDKTCGLGEGGPSTWEFEGDLNMEEDDEKTEEDPEVPHVDVQKPMNVDFSDDEDIQVLEPSEFASR